MNKRIPAALMLALIVTLSGCGRYAAKKSETSAQQTAAAATRTDTVAETSAESGDDAIDSVLDTLDRLGSGVDSLDQVSDSDLIVP